MPRSIDALSREALQLWPVLRTGERNGPIFFLGALKLIGYSFIYSLVFSIFYC